MNKQSNVKDNDTKHSTEKIAQQILNEVRLQNKLADEYGVSAYLKYELFDSSLFFFFLQNFVFIRPIRRNDGKQEPSYLCARKPPDLSFLKNTLKGVESFNSKKKIMKAAQEYELIPEPEEERRVPNLNFLRNSLNSVQSHNNRVEKAKSSEPSKESIVTEEKPRKRKVESSFIKSELEKGKDFNDRRKRKSNNDH
jgi:hypothetical protein